uniref:Si:ch73-379j16.2 n=1 Tax=Neolamprologus brichardi TaxID=32507 RepID=A0A3Q4MGQ4_NEOBR
MAERTRSRTGNRCCFALYLSLLLIFGEQVFAELRYSIPEEMKEGTIVGNVAKDLGLDKTSLADRLLRVVSGSKDAFFEVNPDNGVLLVRKKIDREELCHGSGACMIELKMLVENPLEIHYVAVEITDVNDHSPSFSEKQQTFEVGEQSSPGTRLELHAARDPDAGINSIRTYSLSSNDHFDIEISQSDEEKIPFLILKNSLDREKKHKHFLFVTAVDGGKPPRSGTLNVSITVLDTNDNRPTFKQDTYQIEIFENVSVGTTVANVNATDPDEGTNGELEYSLSKTLARRIYEIFELDSVSGEITLKGGLDFEDSEVYKLDVQASDKGTPPLTSRCRVIVKIKDVNDNRPEIEVTSLSNTVTEDSKPGKVISLISVTDKDSGVNGKIISRITQGIPFDLKPSYKENTYSIVTIKDRGKEGKIPILVLLKTLDRETKKIHKLLLSAIDGGKPSKSGTAEIFIDVLDVNDNMPVFNEDTYSVLVNENTPTGTTIVKVNASDLDEGSNGELIYSLGSNVNHRIRELFRVDPNTGEIIIQDVLDFESEESYEIDIQASDKGSAPLRTDKSVLVKIVDLNDNAPQIEVTSFSKAIPEDARLGTTVALISVIDKDSGLNGKVICSFNEEVPFKLSLSTHDNMYSISTKSPLDREKQAIYDVTIVAKDAGTPSLTSVKSITIIVSDVNDNRPEWRYLVSITPYSVSPRHTRVQPRYMQSGLRAFS